MCILAIAMKHNFVGRNIQIHNLCESEAWELFAKAFLIFLSYLNCTMRTQVLVSQSISTLYEVQKQTEALHCKKMASAEEELPYI